EIVTIGTRRQGRTAIDTAVPIDVFNQEELDSVSSNDMIDVVKTLVPSFNVGREPISDGSSFIRPPQLRGLDSDKTLVLVNGKRRHRAALVVLGGFGAHGPDLATIPSIALKSVEVLRDGASAQYGSDAIAGVLNFNLKDEAEGGEARIQVSRYTEDDKATGYTGALNFGFGLGNSGFVNTSIEISDNEPTSRGQPYDIGIGSSGRTPSQAATDSQTVEVFAVDGTSLGTQQRWGPDAVTQVYAPDGTLLSVYQGTDGILDDVDTRYADNICRAEIGQENNCLTQIWGDPDRDAIRMFVNAGLDINNSTQVYGWANYSDSNSNTSFFHRRPGVSQLLQLREPDGTIYDPRDRYPAGFTPRFFGNVIDYSVLGGVRGEWDNGFAYDFSGRFGHNEIRYQIKNTLNPSMGPASPREFRPGSLENEETEINADFVKAVDIGWANDLNIAFGFAYRDESYALLEGGESSSIIGPYASQDPWNFNVDTVEAAMMGVAPGCYIPGHIAGFNEEAYDPDGVPGSGDEYTGCSSSDPIFNVVPVGSNGFPGYGDTFINDYDRDSYAAYIDFETDITDAFLLNLAARYEDYSDFGDNLSWKLAGRFTVSDFVTLRGSVGTGFRAPTGGQISTVNVSTRIAPDGSPVAEGIFPSDGPIAALFGFSALDAETSNQATFGITATPTDNLTFTLDYYFIELEDRIVLSSDFAVTPAIAQQLASLGVPGANTIAQVSFFTHDVTTETQGIDLVVGYNFDWGAGNTAINLAANWNDTEVTDPGQFLNDETVFDEENNLPSARANVTLRHTWDNDITFSLRANYYGDYKLSDGSNAPLTVENMSAVTQFDADITWDVSDRYRITIGGNNIFDELPDPAPFEACCGRIIASSSVQDWQGPQWYVRGSINW
ncbi:MAG: TonB-dependent receptor, partial [Woeseiaceae bacterium]|nr:TonB-dependent receptor [Woeseiaceae bacterium]